MQTPIPLLPQSPFLTRLLELPYDASARLVARLLPALGYLDVRLSGRRDFKGHNGRDGTSGFDLTASRHGRVVLVQLKQYEPTHKVFQRTLDELRGVALRTGAAEALLITTGTFSPSVDRIALERSPIAPISTLDGEELLALLLKHRVGVKATGAIDEKLLLQLTQEARGNRPGDCTGKAEFVVTVGVKRVLPMRRRRIATTT